MLHVSSPLAAASLRTDDDGATYHVQLPAGPRYTPPEALRAPAPQPLALVFLDAAIAVVEKPAFLPTENTRHIKDSVRARLAELLEARGEASENLRLPHRLDWETSGLMVFARSAAAMRGLAAQFASREVAKTYVADVVGGLPADEGVVDLPLSSDDQRLPLQRVDFGVRGRKARTSWEVLSASQSAGNGRRPCMCGNCCTRVRLRPESGRRHQLRLHMLSLGCPIVNDALYAFGTEHSGSGEQARLHLHAAELCFRHPTTDEQLFFRSDPPFRMPQQRCQLGTVTTTTTTTAGHAVHTSRSASPGSSLAGRPAATLAPRRMCQVAQGSAIAAQ